MPIRIVIVDDDAGFRDAMRSVLAPRLEVEIVGEADSGEAALRLTAEVRPHVVLTDLAMPHMNGVELARRVKANWPGIHVVIVTVHEEDAYRRTAAAAGADAFLLKKRLGVDLWPTLVQLAGDSESKPVR